MERFEITVDEILKVLKGELLSGTLCSFFGVSTDTRLMGPRQLFFAIKGPNYDGHDFVNEARKKGATGAIVSREVEVEDDDFVIIKVKDTRKALLSLAAFWRSKHPQTIVIAITGTNGKTTTKEMLRWLLSAVGPTVASVRSYNNDIGVPLTLFEIRPYHRYCIVEIGASATGEISALAKAAAPDVAVVTNIGTAHLEGFKTRKNIIKTKGEILKALNSNGFAVLNADDSAFESLKDNVKASVFTFSMEEDDADIRPEEVVMQTANIHFVIEDTPSFLPMGGLHNLYNALAALTVVKGLDLDLSRSARRLKGFTPPPMRSNIFYTGPVVTINDAFNSNPSSFNASMAYFDDIASPNKIFVMGDMLELGKESEAFHREAGERLAESSVNTLIVAGSEVKATVEAFKEKCDKPVFHFEPDQRSELVNLLVEKAEGGGAVFVKGSRAMRLENIVSLFLRSLKKLYRHSK